MIFGRNSFKYVFIGAGSSTFTMRLIGDILKDGFFEKGHMALVDIDARLLGEVEEAANRLIGHSGKEYTVSKHIHYKDALDNADFVFFTFAVGGYERWKRDIEVCTRHGILQSVGDTIGPGGLIRTLRTIPLVLDIAAEMEKRCPHAWVINYTNPEGAVCLALQKYTRVNSFGLCHGTPGTAKWLAERVYKVDPKRLFYRAAGINHLTWFTDLMINGIDVYPQLMGKLSESGMDREEPISAKLLNVFGLFPAPGDRHVGEFFPFFMKEKVLHEQDYRWKNNDFKVVDGWRENDRRLFDSVRLHGKGYDELLKGSGETATHLIKALATGQPESQMINIINRGYIDNISEDVIVEIPSFIDAFGLHPQKIGSLPEGIAATCDTLGREYRLIVEAAVTGDRSRAIQAFYMDPLVSNLEYPEALLEALINDNLELLPGYWKTI